MTNKTWQVINGNSAEVLKGYPDNHFDSVVCDPPYGINFLGKSWDSNTGEEEVYRQCLRVLKPGGHLLAFSAARTYHHLAMAVERSGFEIRDQIMWVYGSGFPKSQDVGKAIERREGKKNNLTKKYYYDESNSDKTNPAWDKVKKCVQCKSSTGTTYKKCDREDCIKPWEQDIANNSWAGWGTNLKPAHEPIVMARKPIPTTVIDNVQTWGVGALNIDRCRVEGDELLHGSGKKNADGSYTRHSGKSFGHGMMPTVDYDPTKGRFPANFIHDGSEEVVDLFPDSNGKTNIKPSHEPIVLARKPIPTTIIDNVQTWGVGALNIDRCRVDGLTEQELNWPLQRDQSDGSNATVTSFGAAGLQGTTRTVYNPQGRFPANFIHDGSEEVVDLFPDSNGSGGSIPASRTQGFGNFYDRTEKVFEQNNRVAFNSGSGSAARFFYCAKVSKGERNIGFDPKDWPQGDGTQMYSKTSDGIQPITQQNKLANSKTNNHPTVKPVALMRYLIQLVTPPGGHVLDPFNGSGSTGMAAVELGMQYTGIELDPNYVAIADKRIAAWHDKCNPTVEDKTDPLLKTGLFKYQ